MERPISFSSDMIRAILEGRKTQTKIPVNNRWLPLVEEVVKTNGKWIYSTLDYELTTPYGVPGDRLWVREAWRYQIKDCFGFAGQQIQYRADMACKDIELSMCDVFEDVGFNDKLWHPPLHMSRDYSRITLEITNIRVERLQEISEEDAKAEGIKLPDSIASDRYWPTYQNTFMEYWDSFYTKRGYG